MTCTCPCCCGACCSGGSCVDSLEGPCSGIFQGKGTSCDPNPCAGICCTITGTANTEGVAGFCEETDQATCLANNGTWYSGKTCENAICSCDCADPGFSTTCAGGAASFIIGKACVLPAHIQVTFTTDDSPPVVTVENYYHAAGATFTVACTNGVQVSICVNPDVDFECDPDDGCKETSGGSLTFQECYEGVDDLEPCAQRILCVEDVGCVQAYNMDSAGAYANMTACQDDCAWGLWVGGGPKAQFIRPKQRERTPRPQRVKGPRPEVKRSQSPDVPVGKGPGTELKRLLAKIGIVAAPGCSCNKRARLMDDNGPDWCAENIPTIVGWLEEEHTRQKIKLPFSKLAASLLVRYAIRCARALDK